MSLIQLPDGDVLVGGGIDLGANGDLGLMRYHPDGSSDISWDGDGIARLSLASGTDYAWEIPSRPEVGSGR